MTKASPTSPRISTNDGFEPYAHDVYAWAYRVLGRHDDALDVVQDVYLKWDRQCLREAPSRPRGWLRRVTLNLAIDVRRRRRDEPAATVEVHDSGAPPLVGSERVTRPSDPAAMVDVIDRATLRSDLAAAMDRLSEAQRAVLVAKVYDEMTFAHIADELELAVSTVKTHYLRALRAVRDRLEPKWSRED